MMFGIMNSLVPLFWAFLILLIIMYAFGVFLMSVVGGYLADVEIASIGVDATVTKLVADLDDRFGTMYKAICVLFEAATGGNDWASHSAELKAISEVYYMLFAMYIIFVTLGVLNIVTGFFVDGTMQASKDNSDELKQEDDAKLASMIESLREMFHHADTDCSGTLSLEEFEDNSEWFSILNIKSSDAKDLFVLLDTENTGEVGIDNFLNGLMKVMGTPNSLDICTCLLQNKKILIMLESLISRNSGYSGYL